MTRHTGNGGILNATTKAEGKPKQHKRQSLANALPGGMPASAWAIFGMSWMMLSIIGERLSSFRIINPSEKIGASGLVALAVLIALFIWRRRDIGKEGKRSNFCAICSGTLFCAVSFILYFREGALAEAWWATQVLLGLREICKGLLFFSWARALLHFDGQSVALTFALGALTACGLSFLTIVLKPNAALAVVSMAPLISALALCHFLERLHAWEKSGEGQTAPAPNLQNAAQRKRIARKGDWLIFATTIMLTTFLYAFLFVCTHDHYVRTQDGGTLSTLIQLGTTFGGIAGALLAILLARYLWEQANIELFRMLMLPIITIVLWLSSLANGEWMEIYLALLGITYVLVHLFVMLAPFSENPPASPCILWSLGYLSYLGGKFLSATISPLLSDTAYLGASVGALALLLVTSIIPMLLANMRAGANKSGGVNPANAIEASASSSASAIGGSGENVFGIEAGADSTAQASHALREHDLQALRAAHAIRLREAARLLGAQHGLTEREQETLELLVQGMGSRDIATELVISPQTAKTHRKNIYAKMQVHSQQELIDLAEQYELPSSKEC